MRQPKTLYNLHFNRQTTSMKNIIITMFVGLLASAFVACSQNSVDVKFDNPQDNAQLLKSQKSEIFVPYKQLTSEPDKHWFAYYDKLETDPSCRFVLAMKRKFEGRKPTADDVIEIGAIDLADNQKWIKLGESRAWGWQQGCQFQFVPNTKSKVIWNNRIGDKFVSRIKDIATKEERLIDTPIYALSPCGKWAVTVYYSRVDDMRRGYGYSELSDKFANEKYPKDAGI